MKNLLAVTAVIEVGAGLLLLAFPPLAAMQLFGSPLDTPAGSTVVRIAGAALLTIGVACWLARREARSPAARGLIGALAFYNVAVFAILAYSGLGLGLSSSGLWPAAVVHAIMAGWCLMSVAERRS